MAAEVAPNDQNALPDSLQWMPPGEHEIHASSGGKPVKRKLKVDAAQAARVQQDFLAIKAKADGGTEDRPYFDLNHDDREASAHPTEYVWGGDDPVNGGIRAKVEWSGAGELAVRGKTYRRFSPSFFVNAKGEISLIHAASGEMAVNQGGLVNRAAFKRIQPIWSKDAGAPNDPANQQPNEQPEASPMKSLLAVLAKLGLTTSPDVDEATAVTQVTAKHGELTSASSTATAELSQVKAKLTDTETKLDAAQTSFATTSVDAAIQAGRIPGQNVEVKAKWVALIKADPTNASLLPEPNEALKVIVAKGATKEAASDLAGGGGEHAFMAKAKEYQTEHKVSAAFAQNKVAHQDPKLYDDYRESLGLGDSKK